MNSYTSNKRQQKKKLFGKTQTEYFESNPNFLPKLSVDFVNQQNDRKYQSSSQVTVNKLQINLLKTQYLSSEYHHVSESVCAMLGMTAAIGTQQDGYHHYITKETLLQIGGVTSKNVGAFIKGMIRSGIVYDIPKMGGVYCITWSLLTQKGHSRYKFDNAKSITMDSIDNEKLRVYFNEDILKVSSLKGICERLSISNNKLDSYVKENNIIVEKYFTEVNTDLAMELNSDVLLTHESMVQVFSGFFKSRYGKEIFENKFVVDKQGKRVLKHTYHQDEDGNNTLNEKYIYNVADKLYSDSRVYQVSASQEQNLFFLKFEMFLADVIKGIQVLKSGLDIHDLIDDCNQEYLSYAMGDRSKSLKSVLGPLYQKTFSYI